MFFSVVGCPGVDLIACPSCGRAEVDVIDVANRAMQAFGERKLPLQVAVMGCVVNGPGEALMTDIGLTGGGKGTHQIYIGGETAHRLAEGDQSIVDHLVAMVEKRAEALRK